MLFIFDRDYACHGSVKITDTMWPSPHLPSGMPRVFSTADSLSRRLTLTGFQIVSSRKFCQSLQAYCILRLGRIGVVGCFG